MLCPNDSTEMFPVKIESHYGQVIVLDQCQKCGGIWFDKLELTRARLDQAAKIEQVNTALLVNPTQLNNSRLLCPHDRNILTQFDDKYFPQGIIVAKCPACEGFWLNRGEFARYQNARQIMKQPKEIVISENKFDNDIQRILAQYQSGNSSDTLARLGKFLSTPVDVPMKTVTMKPDGSVEESEASTGVQQTIGTAFNILMLVMRLFLRV